MSVTEKQQPQREFQIVEPREASTPIRIYLPRSFTEDNLITISNKLTDIESATPNSSVEMIVSSTGGNLDGMYELVTRMRHSNLRIATTARNVCKSAAVFVLAAGTPGDRAAYEDVDFMLHPPKFWLNGSQTAAEWLAFAQDSKRKEIHFFRKLATLTKLTEAQGRELFPKDVYFTAEQALSYGIIDRIIPISQVTFNAK